MPSMCVTNGRRSGVHPFLEGLACLKGLGDPHVQLQSIGEGVVGSPSRSGQPDAAKVWIGTHNVSNEPEPRTPAGRSGPDTVSAAGADICSPGDLNL